MRSGRLSIFKRKAEKASGEWYNQARRVSVVVTEETTNLFYVQFLVSRLLTTMPTSLSVV